MFTLEQLLSRVVAATEGLQQNNGQVSSVLTERVLRWYQSRGLLDAPLTYRGRTALYGARHVAQAVAIKRLQSEGRTLAEIFATMAGLDDSALAALSGLVDQGRFEEVGGSMSEPELATPKRGRRQAFWRAPADGTDRTIATETGIRPPGGDHAGVPSGFSGDEMVVPGLPASAGPAGLGMPDALSGPVQEPSPAPPEGHHPISSPEKQDGAAANSAATSTPSPPPQPPPPLPPPPQPAPPTPPSRHHPISSPEKQEAPPFGSPLDGAEGAHGTPAVRRLDVRIAIELAGGYTLLLPPGAELTPAVAYALIGVSDYLLPLSPQFDHADAET